MPRQPRVTSPTPRRGTTQKPGPRASCAPGSPRPGQRGCAGVAGPRTALPRAHGLVLPGGGGVGEDQQPMATAKWLARYATTPGPGVNNGGLDAFAPRSLGQTAKILFDHEMPLTYHPSRTKITPTRHRGETTGHPAQEERGPLERCRLAIRHRKHLQYALFHQVTPGVFMNGGGMPVT